MKAMLLHEDRLYGGSLLAVLLLLLRNGLGLGLVVVERRRRSDEMSTRGE